ncbi:MAG: hypothetical protein HYS27_07160 [Deltaproteobacteria bacterium]|nr:hypothetical protein [Deltaproteobacteria bacterium]
MSRAPAVVVLLELVLLGAVGARAGEDPSDVPPPPADGPPPAEAPADPPPAVSPPAEAPPPDAPPPDALPPEAQPPYAASARAADPLVDCRALVLDERWDDAERCLQVVVAAPDAPEPLARRAAALREVVAAWRRHLDDAARAAEASAAAAAAPTTPLTPSTPREQLKVSELVDESSGEAMVHGAAGGAGAGFLVSAAIASATRASEQDTIGWLIAAPAAGGVVGALGGYVAERGLRPSVGDLRLATSSMWMGATQGFLLQWAVFDQSADAGAVPLRFLTILGGGALGLGAGAALSPLVDVEDGDVAVAHSAALWGGVLTTIVLTGTAGSWMSGNVPVVLAVIAGGIGVPYLGALAAHSALEIERWPSFLIDAGGAAGLLVTTAFITVTNAALLPNSAAVAAALTVGTTAGLAIGSVAAWYVSAAVRQEARALLRGADDEGEE